MTTLENEKIKNCYNALRKNRPGDEASPSQVPYVPNIQTNQVQQETTTQANIAAPKKRIKHDPVTESGNIFKDDLMCKGVIDAEQWRKKKEEEKRSLEENKQQEEERKGEKEHLQKEKEEKRNQDIRAIQV